MAAGILDDLGQLTGEEIMQLHGQLSVIETTVRLAPQSRRMSDDEAKAIGRFHADIIELQADVLVQIARIRVPLIEAQGIIQRAIFRRGHIVPVARTS